VGLAGITVRPIRKARSTWITKAPSQRAYFRTSLYTTTAPASAPAARCSRRSRCRATSASSNENPSPDARYEFSSRESALGLLTLGRQESERDGRVHAVHPDDIDHRVPQQLSLLERSFYRDKANTATDGRAGAARYAKLTLRLSLGGSLFVSAGERPTRYYQPMGRPPLEKRVYRITEWRWFGSESGLRFRLPRPHFRDWAAPVR
jgi:hypothetical protein